MAGTLEKYQRCRYATLEANQPAKDTQSSYQEYLKLKAKAEALQHTQRNLLGEELEHLSAKELDQLEHQLDQTLKQIRSTKTQFLLDQLSDLQKKLNDSIINAGRSSYNPSVTNQANPATSAENANGIIPGWML
ncbi:mads-box protein cmb1 [Quercus suber]|uniref:Mads-box protein cmb1 n=1 Tax=Quercus suber TaxID=58331 RepID=A0AAW0ME21_QUESU